MGIIKFKNEAEETPVKAETLAEAAGEPLEEGVQNPPPEETAEEPAAAEVVPPARFGDESVVSEDRDARTENSRFYFCNDGTGKQIFTSAPLHYFNEEEGKLRSIDNTLTEKEDGYETQYGTYKAELSKKIGTGRTMRFMKGDIGVEWNYLPQNPQTVAENGNQAGVAQVQNYTDSVVSGSGVVYENADPGVDLSYQIYGGNVKENIIVKEPGKDYRYRFSMQPKGVNLRLSEDRSSIELYSTQQLADGTVQDKTEFIIPGPFMTDAAGNRSDEVYYELDPAENGSYVFSVVADPVWMNDALRVYPVTIDPQLITADTALITYQNYTIQNASYVDFNNHANWTQMASDSICASYQSDKLMKCRITVNRSKFNLSQNRICKATLRLYVKKAVGDGAINICGTRYLDTLRSEDVENVDITNNFINQTDSFQIEIAPIYKDTRATDVAFYATGVHAPVVEVEYLLNENERPTRKTFSLAGVATGEFNVSSGELVTSFEDVAGDAFALPYSIRHVYKRKGEDEKSFYGKNFHLNLCERLVKNTDAALSANYLYTDASGEKHGFRDLYYYYKVNGEKTTIADKSKIEILPDGTLRYTDNSGKYEVKKDQRTSAGLKLVTEYEGFKNSAILEQRSDECKQLQEQTESLENSLKEFVKFDKNSKIVSEKLENRFVSGELTKAALETFLTTSGIVLSKSEVPNYHSLLLQQKSLENAQVSAAEQKNSLKLQLEALHLQDRMLWYQSRSLDRQYATDTNQLISITVQKEKLDKTDQQQNVLDGQTNYIKEYQIDAVDQKNILNAKQNPNKDGVESGINSAEYQHDNLMAQKASLNTQLSNFAQTEKETDEQLKLVKDQIKEIESTQQKYKDQIRKLYKEYYNTVLQLKSLDRQLPRSYLSDGDIVKGFNKDGYLVAISDAYNNLLTVEYDDEHRVVKVSEDEQNFNLFRYNLDGNLASVTDTMGRTVRYTYDKGKMFLTKVTYWDGRTLEIEYARTTSVSDIASIKSSDKLKTVLTYNGGLSTITQYSLAANGIYKNNQTTTEAPTQLSKTTVTYDNTTSNFNGLVKIATDDSAEYYTFLQKGVNSMYVLEEGGVVSKAEKYTYTPYVSESVTYADESTLNVSAYAAFTFTNGERRYTKLNEFNQPSTVQVSNRKLSATATFSSDAAYTYDDDQKLERVETSTYTTIGAATKTRIWVTRNAYNAQGSVVRTETFVKGEEETRGIDVEETEYNDKGKAVRTAKYNSLDSATKFVQESVYDDKGMLVAEKDATGEQETRYEYEPGSATVRTEKYPGGGRISYGRASDGSVTAITASTEEGEGNGTQTLRTCGLVTEVRSGKTVVNYEYDQKRRLKKVKLGGADYLTYNYEENLTVGGVKCDRVSVTNAKGEKFYTTTDKRGNVVRFGNDSSLEYGLQMTYEKNRLTEIVDVPGKLRESRTYDALGNLTARTGKTYSGVIDSREAFTYNDHGELATRQISEAVSHNYAYNYADTAGRELQKITFNRSGENFDFLPKYDVNGRVTDRLVAGSSGTLSGTYVYYRKCGDHATNQISSLRYGDRKSGTYTVEHGLKYAYDPAGNIARVYEDGLLSVRYTYDRLNRLVREDNRKMGKTTVFAYDTAGNILSRSEANYTVRPTEEIAFTSVKRYAYEDAGDRLLSFDGEKMVYDAVGNPTTYRGKSLTFGKGRQLNSYDCIRFTYDLRGRRQCKGDTAYYYDGDGKLLREGNYLEFIYDDTGIAGIHYCYRTYFFRKNAQGDVIALVDNSGQTVVQYVYDAWGNHLVLKPDGSENTRSDFIGNINPIRYRGYYYDKETGLYYLKSRYYDPETGRFINIDDTDYLDPDTIGGINLYAYCNNNPVMNVDPDGTKWSDFWNNVKKWGKVIGVTALAVTAIAVGVFVPVGAILGAAFIGAGIGAIGAEIGSIVAQGGFASADPNKVFKSGLIGGAIGFISGLASGTFSVVGQIWGQQMGLSLSAMNLISNGAAISQVYSAPFLYSLGGTIGGVIGGILGGIQGNYIANDLFGIKLDFDEMMDEGIKGEIPGWIINIFRWLSKQ